MPSVLKNGLQLKDKVYIKYVHTKDLTLSQRLWHIRHLFKDTILNTTMVMDMDLSTDSVDIKSSPNVLSGILYLYNILTGNAWVIELANKQYKCSKQYKCTIYIYSGMVYYINID